MARPNKFGNSFMALALDKQEERAVKQFLKDKGDISGKQYLRYLIRKHLRETYPEIFK